MATENYSNIRVSGATSPPPDYTDLISWNAGEKIYNWPALDQIPVALIYDDWTDGISGCYPSVDLAGWTLDATHPCVWRAAPGSEIDPVTKSGAKITRNPSDTFGIVARANHWMRIEGLGVHLPGLTTRALTYIQHQKIVFDRCAIYDCALLYETGLIAGRQDINNSTVEVAGMTSSGGAALQLYAINNATVIQLAGKGGWNGQIALHSCTINNVAVYNGNAKSTLDTCYSCTGNYNAQNNNGSAPPPGANSINTLVTADFADFAGGDYHLAVASALIGLGENKYSAYQFDIDGDEWPSSGSWDIGADYYTTGGPAAQQIYPTSIVSAEAFGNPSVIAGAVQVIMQAIASAEAHGTPIVTSGGITLLPSSIGSAEAFGDPNLVAGAVNIDPAGIGSDEAVGVPAISTGATIQPTGIVSAEAIGSSTITPGVIVITPSAIASNEAIGNPVVTQGGAFILPEGIGTGETFGAIQIDAGAVTVQPLGIESGETFGTHAVTPGSWIIMPPGIATAEDFGDVLIITGGAVISPAGIQSAEAFGSVTIIGGEQILGWLLGEISIGPALSGYVRSGKETRH
ncbi:MAG: hypothetical protein KDI55_02445 [Anaerolineae bacterium]|nr:hypothetical protein [Anaerolineae bacterium]